jgi:hypothetical protein
VLNSAYSFSSLLLWSVNMTRRSNSRILKGHHSHLPSFVHARVLENPSLRELLLKPRDDLPSSLSLPPTTTGSEDIGESHLSAPDCTYLAIYTHYTRICD